MKKIAFIGGGSAKFVRTNVIDLLSFPELREAGFELNLMDINPQRLDRARALLEKMISEQKANLYVRATTDLQTALSGADFVIITIMVGGLRHYESDTFIPARHGVLQAVGDTIGPGSILRTLRTAPVLQQIVGHLRLLAPNAWVINYANPMAMLTRVLIEAGHEKTVGLCHSIQSTIPIIARWLNLPAAEIDYTAAGLNHVNFYLKLEHRGRDLYPDLLANADRIIREAETWEADAWAPVARGYERVRMELVKYLGYLPAEGPWHQGDYYPWFRKNRELLKQYGPQEGWSYNFDRILAEKGSQEIDDLISGQEKIKYDRSNDYGVQIIHSLATGSLRKIHGNVRNDGSIENLPRETVVEVPCMVDSTGLTPCRAGRIPPQLAAVMLPHAAVHELTLAAIREKSRTLLRQALQADPLTAAVLTLPQIDALAHELFDENKDYLHDWKD
ncbi:MAG: alpha-glucosidase/alpha-galactosidase [Planctomycetes bacterium]|nr:alpha-glucosidase/alpha-galactosidase [Planctomycetota bacterium]